MQEEDDKKKTKPQPKINQKKEPNGVKLTNDKATKKNDKKKSGCC